MVSKVKQGLQPQGGAKQGRLDCGGVGRVNFSLMERRAAELLRDWEARMNTGGALMGKDVAMEVRESDEYALRCSVRRSKGCAQERSQQICALLSAHSNDLGKLKPWLENTCKALLVNDSWSRKILEQHLNTVSATRFTSFLEDLWHISMFHQWCFEAYRKCLGESRSQGESEEILKLESEIVGYEGLIHAIRERMSGQSLEGRGSAVVWTWI